MHLAQRIPDGKERKCNEGAGGTLLEDGAVHTRVTEDSHSEGRAPEAGKPLGVPSTRLPPGGEKIRLIQ